MKQGQSASDRRSARFAMNSWQETRAQRGHNPAGPKSRIIEDRACNTSVGSNMEALREYGIVPSMSRPANPYDNASCEIFTGLTG
jgi:transposase InsO family protein